MSRPEQTEAAKAFGRSLGTVLGAHRKRLSLSGGDLATASGVSLDAIRSIESGRVASPGVFAVYRLSEALGVSLDTVARSAADAVGGPAKGGRTPGKRPLSGGGERAGGPGSREPGEGRDV